MLVVMSLQAQVTITPTNNATTLAQSLLGTGVTLSNATLNCGAAPSGSTNYGSGLFTVTSSNLGMDSGIVLTSGQALTSAGTVASFASGSTGNGADPD